jgi:hypothetical protein
LGSCSSKISFKKYDKTLLAEGNTFKISMNDEVKNNLLSHTHFYVSNFELRIKMIDLIMGTNLELKNHFKAIQILDIYLNSSMEKITKINFNLLKMLSIFIVNESKYSLNNFHSIIDAENLDLDIFNRKIEIFKEIKSNKLELNMFEYINSLIDISTFCKEFLEENSLFITHLKLFSIYIAKIILHFEDFNHHKSKNKSSGCILFALDHLKNNLHISENNYKYIKGWFNKLRIGFKSEPIYDEINEACEKYFQLDFIKFNINDDNIKKLKFETYLKTSFHKS